MYIHSFGCVVHSCILVEAHLQWCLIDSCDGESWAVGRAAAILPMISVKLVAGGHCEEDRLQGGDVFANDSGYRQRTSQVTPSNS